MNSADAIRELLALGRGARPASLSNPEAEETLNLALALLVELAVANERIDRLERLVAERTGLPLAELRALDYAEGPAATERAEALEALILRVLRIRLDPRAAPGAPAAPR